MRLMNEDEKDVVEEVEEEEDEEDLIFDPSIEIDNQKEHDQAFLDTFNEIRGISTGELPSPSEDVVQKEEEVTAEAVEPEEKEESQPEAASSENVEKTFEDRVRSLEHRYGNLLQENQQLKQQINNFNAPSPVAQESQQVSNASIANTRNLVAELKESDEFKEFIEYNQEGGPVLEKMMLQIQDALGQGLTDPRIDLLINRDLENRAVKMEAKHPNWVEISQTQEFKNWLSFQDHETQKSVIEEDDVDKWIKVLDMYAENLQKYTDNDKNTGEKDDNRDDEVLRQATPATGKPTSSLNETKPKSAQEQMDEDVLEGFYSVRPPR